MISYAIGMSSSEDEEDTTDKEVVKCKKCEFETTSEHGLNVHQYTNHSNVLFCEICDLKAETQS